jgi:hypothetical protein
LVIYNDCAVYIEKCGKGEGSGKGEGRGKRIELAVI